MSDIERTSTTNEKTGCIHRSSYAINPLTGTRKCRSIISDYVLMGYGTGAIMAVPAHDQRDFEFATKFGIDIVPVVDPQDPEVDVNHLTQACAAVRHDDQLRRNHRDAIRRRDPVYDRQGWRRRGSDTASVNYKLRDWLISQSEILGHTDSDDLL